MALAFTNSFPSPFAVDPYKLNDMKYFKYFPENKRCIYLRFIAACGMD